MRACELLNHIGVNTGEVIAGDASTGQRLVTGDAVNMAARLEQAAGPAEVIIGDLTYRLARDYVEVEVIPPLALKGKAEPVPAYRLVARPRGAGRASDGGDHSFVGREAEMARLSGALFTAAETRQARLITVVGDAGVGKSRLIREFAHATAGEARLVRGPLPPVRRRHHVLAAGRGRPRGRGDRRRRRARRWRSRRSASCSPPSSRRPRSTTRSSTAWPRRSA